MEKSSNNNNNNNHHNRERALNAGGTSTGSGDHGLLRSTTHPPETRSAVATTSSDFFLQWGNRKRLRCMKIQNKDQTNSSAAAAAAPAQRTTARVDRRVVRSEKETASHHANGNGYLNLRQRASSPSHRILRNSESAMKSHGNGVRALSSPDRAQDRRTHHSNAAASNGNHHHHHHHGRDDDGKQFINNGGAGGSGSTETGAAQDSKKVGGTSSGSGDGIPAVWPPKFVIGLSNKEKEEDFIAFKGSKLPQRPKKRAKFIQRTINLVSPGGWLCDLTLERYEVREKKITKKRPRGLKAMGNMESDSE